MLVKNCPICKEISAKCPTVSAKPKDDVMCYHVSPSQDMCPIVVGPQDPETEQN